MLVSNMIDIWSYLVDNLIKNSIDAKLENELLPIMAQSPSFIF